MRIHFLESLVRQARTLLSSEKGSMIWYLFWAFAAIAVFYAIFFFLWGSIKGWFISGS